ncbi:MAG: SLC13 family permease, partial [Gemmatimonadetes bacterium]|nr:SLC13 family permease [Gemmatimonadota bacterium]
MPWHAWFTLAVVLVTVVVLARDLVAPATTMMGGAVFLLLAGVLTPVEAFAGFGNPAPITVAALYILARAVEKTGLLNPLVYGLLGRRSQPGRWTLLRLLIPAALASAFLNNTPIIAMLIPVVLSWSERRGQSPSLYLMPLSFAVVLGGVVTTIGTSTNLVVSGLLEAEGMEPFRLFELTPIGLPVLASGLAVLVLAAPILLRQRAPVRGHLEQSLREFVVFMDVDGEGPLVGRTIEEAGLRNLEGVFLAHIERDEEVLAPVPPTMALHAGDRLCFAGRVDLIVDLQSQKGLRSSEQHQMVHYDTARHAFFEAVIGPASPLVNRTVKEVEFRSRYQAAVVAIHRSGEHVHSKPGDVRLRVGDTLLLLADPDFRARWRDRNDFLLVAPMRGTPPGVTRKAWIVAATAIGIVFAGGLGLLPILQAALAGVAVLLFAGVLTAVEARDSVDLDVVLLIAASFAYGLAIEKTGLAAVVAHGIETLT